MEQAGASAEPKSLSLWLPSFSDHFPSCISGSYLGSECLICSIRTLILLSRILPLFVYSDANSMLDNAVNSQFCCGNICGAFLFEQYPFPWYLQYHPSCRFACMWPKEQLRVFWKAWRTCSGYPASFPLCWSFWWISLRGRGRDGRQEPRAGLYLANFTDIKSALNSMDKCNLNLLYYLFYTLLDSIFINVRN